MRGEGFSLLSRQLHRGNDKTCSKPLISRDSAPTGLVAMVINTPNMASISGSSD